MDGKTRVGRLEGLERRRPELEYGYEQYVRGLEEARVQTGSHKEEEG